MYSALLTAIVLWISANFALPPNYDHPNIKLVPAEEITFLRYRAFTAAQQREVANQLQQSNGMLFLVAAKLSPYMMTRPVRYSYLTLGKAIRPPTSLS